MKKIFLSLIQLTVITISITHPAVSEELTLYHKLESWERSMLIDRAVEQISDSYPRFNKNDFPRVSVAKNDKEILLVFFHPAFVATGNEGKIYQVSAYLVSGDVVMSRIQRPFGANPDWPFGGFSTIDYNSLEFYIPDQKELETIDKIYSLFKFNKLSIPPDTRIFIFENQASYGTVVTDGFWTGFSLFDKHSGIKKDMGYMDEISSPPKNPWQYIY